MSDNEQHQAEQPRGLRAYAEHAQSLADNQQNGAGPVTPAAGQNPPAPPQSIPAAERPAGAKAPLPRQDSVPAPGATRPLPPTQPAPGSTPGVPQQGWNPTEGKHPAPAPMTPPMAGGPSQGGPVPGAPLHTADSVPPPPAEASAKPQPTMPPAERPTPQQAPPQAFDPEATLLRPIGYSQIPPAQFPPAAPHSAPRRGSASQQGVGRADSQPSAWAPGQQAPDPRAPQGSQNFAGQPASQPCPPQPTSNQQPEAEAKKPFFVPNGPNILTLLRIVAVPVFAVMLLMHPHDPAWRIATTAVFVVAIVTDLIDGWWARKANLITDFGKMADPIADKALTGMAFIGLSILGELSWWVTGIVLLREWGITVLRMVMLKRGRVMAAKKGGKLKTVTQAIALSLFLLPLVTYHWGEPFSAVHIPEIISWIVMAVAVIATVFSGIDIVKDAIVGERPQEDDDYYYDNE